MSRVMAGSAAVALANGRVGRMSERQFQEAVIELARLTRWAVYHTHDSRHSTQGFPDLVLVRPPLVVFVELKLPGQHPTAYQKGWLRLLDLCPGVAAYLWTPDDWPDIKRVLTQKVP